MNKIADRTTCYYCDKTVRKIDFGRGKVFIGYQSWIITDKGNPYNRIVINKCDECISKYGIHLDMKIEPHQEVHSMYYKKRLR